MKKFFKIFEKDLQTEDFSAGEILMYGLVVPAIFILILAFIGWVNI